MNINLIHSVLLVKKANNCGSNCILLLMVLIFFFQFKGICQDKLIAPQIENIVNATVPVLRTNDTLINILSEIVDNCDSKKNDNNISYLLYSKIDSGQIYLYVNPTDVGVLPYANYFGLLFLSSRKIYCTGNKLDVFFNTEISDSLQIRHFSPYINEDIELGNFFNKDGFDNYEDLSTEWIYRNFILNDVIYNIFLHLCY